MPRPQAVPLPTLQATLTRPRLILAVVALLGLHYALAASSLLRENPTIDEVVHLPAGISYWQKGTFKLYPHNPPLIKLVAALPVVGASGDRRRADPTAGRRPGAPSRTRRGSPTSSPT